MSDSTKRYCFTCGKEAGPMSVKDGLTPSTHRCPTCKRAFDIPPVVFEKERSNDETLRK